MALSIYVHIPYCLQRCRYCDFTTFERQDILPPEKYVEQVRAEIQARHHRWLEREVATVYFGGGTPSLIDAKLVRAILQELTNAGFHLRKGAEVTIEINPATMDESKLDAYLEMGINRFSVGAQTFNDEYLKICGRRHNANDTRATLKILQKRNLNYSFDLLFALPNQSLADVKTDLKEVCEFNPPHLSAYCLTVPDGHPMSRGRAPEDEQVEMFHAIENSLAEIDLEKYEISNFAKAGFESRHNLVYWADQSFWGIGVSAHSYDAVAGPFGERFWNSKDLREYGRQSAMAELPKENAERLERHEAMTDFCHMFLRTRRGLSTAALRKKFDSESCGRIMTEIERLCARRLLKQDGDRFHLSPDGELISNQVFERLTFLRPSRFSALRA